MTQTPTQYTSDGVEIVAVQQGTAPHPHPSHNRKLVPFNYLEELLLVDDTTRYRCVKPVDGANGSGPVCGRDTFTSATSAVAHMNSHGRRERSYYPLETLKLLVRLVRIAERDHGERGKCVIVADELNRREVPTYKGDPWNAEQVSHLYNDHKDKIRVRVDGRARVTTAREVRSTDMAQPENTAATATTAATTTPAPAAASGNLSLAALDARSVELTRRTGELFDDYKRYTADMADFVSDVVAALHDLAEQPSASAQDITDAQKWRKYLEIRKLIEE